MPLSPRSARAQAVLPACLAWLALALPQTVVAELPWCRLDSLFPAGAKAGTTVPVHIAGAETSDATDLWFSHPGVVGRRIENAPDSGPAFEVSISEDVPPGLYDVRLHGRLGLSNASTFAVGRREEVLEQEPNDTAAEATPAAVGAVLNGRISRPAGIDSYRFTAAPGRKLVIDCLAARIDSPLRPVLELLDARGRRVAFTRSGRSEDPLLVFDPPAEAEYTLRVYDQTYRGGEQFVYRVELHADPQVLAVRPLSGTPGSEVEAQLLGFNLPAGQPSDRRWRRLPLELARSTVHIPADPFPLDRILPVTPREAAVDAFSWRLLSPPIESQPVRLFVGSERALLESEPNQTFDQAQSLTMPADVTGEFGTMGDRDVYAVDVQKGEPVWIEVFADRLGSPADPVLTIDWLAAGTSELTRVAEVDDSTASLLPVGFETRSDDPAYRFDPPGDGRCLIQLRDRYGQTRGDATLAYRLVVRRPRPDFRVVAIPVAGGPGRVAPAAMRRGDAFPMLLVAFREDGFNGAIEVPAADWGRGLSNAAAEIPAGQAAAPLVVHSAEDAAVELHSVELFSQSAIAAPEGGDELLRRPVRLATTTHNSVHVEGRDTAATVRLARDWVMSVTPETAPLLLQHDFGRQTVAQGQPLEGLLRLTRREGAAGPVTVTAPGLAAAAKIESPEVTFAAGETEKPVRLTIGPDAPLQTVVIQWQAKSRIQHQPRATALAAGGETPPPQPAKEIEVTTVAAPLLLEIRPAPGAEPTVSLKVLP